MRRDDELFVGRCLAGDQAAFTALVSKYREMVHAYAYCKVGSYQEADTNEQMVLEPVSEVEILNMGSEDISSSDLALADAGTTTQTQPTAGTESSGVVVRRVWDNAPDFMDDVSPDGRYLSYINCFCNP